MNLILYIANLGMLYLKYVFEIQNTILCLYLNTKNKKNNNKKINKK